jgi:hypothetical protein
VIAAARFVTAPLGAIAALFFVLFAPALAALELQRIEATDGATNDAFGRSVGISGNTAIVGAWTANLPGQLDAGAAYIFREAGGNWSQLDKLMASDGLARDMFGISVGISGNTAVVGAPNKDAGSDLDAGAAYVFRDNGAGDWTEIAKLVPTDLAAGDEFGYSVAISGNTAIVGAWRKGGSTGAAYIFRDNGAGMWPQVAKLTPVGATPSSQFGSSVALDGTSALVGAWFDSQVAPLAGAAYVFADGGMAGWSQVDKLVPNDAALGQQFGNAVALAGGTAVIGANGDGQQGPGTGAAYIFQPAGPMDWQQVDKLLPADPVPIGRFGNSVGIAGNTAIVGAFQNEVVGEVAGAAYLFRDNGADQWNQISKLAASDGMGGDSLGFSAAIGSGTAIAGALLDDDMVSGVDAGSAYLFSVPGPVLAGDYNGDVVVNAADYTTWRNMQGQTGSGLAADGNGDDVVNLADYRLWKRNYGRTMATGAGSVLAAAIPEPNSAVLLLVAGLLAVLWRPVFSDN